MEAIRHTPGSWTAGRPQECCRLAKRLVPLAVKTDAVAEAFSWASFINQTGISKALLNNNLTKLGEKLCSEHRALDFHYAVFDNAYKDRLLAEL